MRTLVIITRYDGGESQVGLGKLWSSAGMQLLEGLADRICVVQGENLPKPDFDNYGAMLRTAVGDELVTTTRLLGLINHTTEPISTATRDNYRSHLGRMDLLVGKHSTTDRYQRLHEQLAQAFQDRALRKAEELFDQFWLVCFGDPELEALIHCLKEQALSKVDGRNPITSLDASLGSAYTKLVDAGGLSTAQGFLNQQPAELGGYERLRQGLIAAIKEREELKRNGS